MALVRSSARPLTERVSDGVHRHFNDEEKSFIDGLLQVDLTRRLGCMYGGVKDVFEHKYFADVDWNAMRAQVGLFSQTLDCVLCVQS